MVHHLKHMLAACVAIYAVAAGAETLSVSGVYPAGNDAAAELDSIVVERFGGADGELLGIATADRLRGVSIGGEPYFRVVPAGSAAEAVLQGTATAEVRREDSGTREQEVCVERDEDRECIRREKRHLPCWDHKVRLDASIRLVRREGTLVYAFDPQGERALRYCEGDSRPSTESMVREMAREFADRVRYDLAPVQRTEDIRVMEDRDGLPRPLSTTFREAVRLTKTDPAAACAAWAGLEEGNPPHASVLFNIGLCAESGGQLDIADGYYLRALAVDDDADYAEQGVRRIERRRHAEAQLASHR